MVDEKTFISRWGLFIITGFVTALAAAGITYLLLSGAHGDRPIIVKGGSVDIDFNHADYVRNTNNTYYSSRSKITAVRVYNNDPGVNMNDNEAFRDFDITSATKYRIRIDHDRKPELPPTVPSDGPAGQITIEDSSTTAGLYIKFDEAIFEPRPHGVSPDKIKSHFNRKRKIRFIEVWDVTNNKPAGCKNQDPDSQLNPADCKIPKSDFISIHIGGK